MNFLQPMPKVAIVGAWLLFAASFFLPAAMGSLSEMAPDVPLTGWKAFVQAPALVFGEPLLLLVDPLRALLLFAFPLVNLPMLFALVPALAWDRSAFLGLVLVPCGLLAFVVGRALYDDLLIGFYLWGTSFFLMSAGCVMANVLRHQTDLRENQRIHAQGV